MTDFCIEEKFDINTEQFVSKLDCTKVTSTSPPPAFIRLLNETSFVKEDEDLKVVEGDGEPRVTMALMQYLLYTLSKPYTTKDADIFHEKMFGRAFLGQNKWQWLKMHEANQYVKNIKSAPLRKLWVTRKSLRKQKKAHPKKGVQYLSTIPLHLAYRFLRFLSDYAQSTSSTNNFWQLVQAHAKLEAGAAATLERSEIHNTTMESQECKIQELEEKLAKNTNPTGTEFVIDNVQPSVQAVPTAAVPQLQIQKQRGVYELTEHEIVKQLYSHVLEHKQVKNEQELRMAEHQSRMAEHQSRMAEHQSRIADKEISKLKLRCKLKQMECESPSKRQKSTDSEASDIKD